MNSITLAILFAATSSVATVAHAQDPVPPARPARPAPVAVPAPAPTPRPAMAPRAIMEIDAESIREMTRAAREMSRDLVPSREEITRMAEDARELTRSNADMNREMSRMNAEMARESSRMAMETSRLDMMGRLAPMPPMTPMPAMPPMPSFDYSYNYNFGTNAARSDGFALRAPPAPWAQGDPADSLYRVARDAFNRGEYGRAAKMFEDIRSKYPKSAYLNDSQYYEAYSRYRIGTTDELHTAAKLLEPLASKVINTDNSSTPMVKTYYDGSRRGASDGEVAALYTRINGALAQRGDKAAADKIAQYASKTGTSTCDNEEVQVRVEAMNALSQMDPNGALGQFKRVLDHKDECSAELRRRAAFMLGRRNDAESTQLLIATAKSDPSITVRTEAINALPRLQGDVGLNALEDMLRTEQDERVQNAIARALMSSDNQKARTSMRALIDRKDAPLKLRLAAISGMNNGERATTDDAAYLRGLYGRADNNTIKDAVLNAVSRMGGPENDKWLLGIAQNTNEPSELRAVAISRLMRSNVSIGDLSKLYDAADNLSVRQQIVSVLGSRKEPEATDKLIDIYRNSTVTQIRLQAINALGRKNDPRTVEMLNNILDGKKP